MTPEELTAWSSAFIRRRFERGLLMNSSELIRFSSSSPEGKISAVFSSDREEVLREAAKYYEGCNRIIAITGGSRPEGRRVLVADVYDRASGTSAAVEWRWRMTLGLKGRLVGQPSTSGPAMSLQRARRLP